MDSQQPATCFGEGTAANLLGQSHTEAFIETLIKLLRNFKYRLREAVSFLGTTGRAKPRQSSWDEPDLLWVISCSY